MAPKCLTKKECIDNCKKVHPYYIYDNTEFVNTRTKINVVCPEHGEFKVLYYTHIRGSLCKKCQTYGRFTQEQCIEKFKTIHGDKYNYDKFKYIQDSIKGIVICKIHGEFVVSPNHHHKGKGCPKCAGKYITTEEFIDRATKKHKGKYNYDKTVYKNSISKVLVTCIKHGYFNTTPNEHLAGNGCPICKLSKGSLKVKSWLDEHNVKYEVEKRFLECKSKKPLPFDFYLPEHNCCIEFDGIQHFKVIPRSKDHNKNLQSFINTNLNDMIKNTYCLTNNIKLIRIPYTKQNIIEEILEEQL